MSTSLPVNEDVQTVEPVQLSRRVPLGVPDFIKLITIQGCASLVRLMVKFAFCIGLNLFHLEKEDSLHIKSIAASL